MTSDVQPPTAASGRTPGLAFIFLTMLLDVVGFGIVIPIMPQLVTSLSGGDLSHSATYYGATMSLYTLVQFLCAPTLGALSDRFGRKPVLLASLFASASAYLFTALAPSIWLLLAARALGGLGGASMSVATTYIADISTPERRAQNFGLMGVAFGLGFIAGPALGGLLGGFGARIPFFAAAAVTLLNFLYGLVVVPESLRPENRRALNRQALNPFGWAALVRKYPLVTGLFVAMIWNGLSFGCLQSNWVPYTTYRFAWTPGQTGLSLAVVGLTAAIVQGGLIRLILPRLGERRAIAFGLGLSAVSMALFGLATQGWMMYAILIVNALSGVAGPAMQAQISKEVPSNEQGGVQGALTSLMSLTGIVAPMVANALFGLFTGATAPLHVPGIAFFLASLLAVVALAAIRRVFARHLEPEAPVVSAIAS